MPRSVITAVLAVLTALLLVACGGPGFSKATVAQALTIQLQTATRQLNQQLHLPPEGSGPIEVSAVKVTGREPIEVAGLPGYRVTGTCTLHLKVPGQQVRVPDSAFEVYLQQQREGKSWRLARPRIGTEPGATEDWDLVVLSP
ncbi:hypothetical protein [Leptolyngbya sp. FACHB-261]|uniref:hypothetical protein n=1 Tax=Leptolyngbya sp. FACHB-261 TaxID=2692806 RepID=UPI0016879D5A|nr:hypothetical protein [Leptolyngbya sp. FACHB-261]MBD2100714.1 hypothetical protein [Leptolyngbya sp. FACHB-261]